MGSLVEITGVFTLVRALAALGRSAVLTLIRGLRRGEVRFFHGEVTSAQVGLIHGQAIQVLSNPKAPAVYYTGPCRLVLRTPGSV